ncbi:MAG TPA: hypothetical protein VFT53_01225 [Candidatus Saccharimonadales bacterium]|nr:hypothetical protein [Candidatus Saccharimonadales bacterium]
MRQRLRRFLWVLPVAVLAGVGLVAWSLTHAQQRIVSCTGADASQFGCWQQRYSAMVQQQSPEAAFVDFKQVYNTNAYVKSNCHQLAHVIGRAAAKKYVTLAETYRHGDNFCWSGYYHGAVEAIAGEIGAANIVAQINTVCAPFANASVFERYNCVHGMGHGLMAVEDDNLFTALSLCDRFNGQWNQESCYSGVFMENVMNEINPGQHAKYLKADDPLYPCTAVADKYKEQCFLMQTSHALIVEKYDYAKVFAVCSTVAAPFDATCYQSLGRDISGQSSSDQSRTVALCMLGQTQAAQENCFVGAVKDFISYYHSDTQGMALCAAIPDATLSAGCAATGKTYYQQIQST